MHERRWFPVWKESRSNVRDGNRRIVIGKGERNLAEKLLSALHFLKPGDLDYDGWLRVGMALKHEGYPCIVWDEWSREDVRYRAGECERKWVTFDDYHGIPVKGGSIVQLAKERGWQWQKSENKNRYSGDTDRMPAVGEKMTPCEQLQLYLETLFQPADIVGYVSADVWKGRDGKYMPSKGVYNRTAGDLLEAINHHPDDLGAVIGDWKEECGAWIRFNPLDGQGVKNENVTAYRYALVESDTVTPMEQEAIYRRLELPVAAMVYSGGKSIHAIVHIDAENEAEYRERVAFLYDALEKNGCAVDKQNRNPSRLSRMPGVTRKGKQQQLLAINIGKSCWQEWVESYENAADGLPEFDSYDGDRTHLPEKPEEIIEGILRRGHKMLISGPSKAGKSFLLLELCVALAEGIPWLGFPCRQSRVLYINLEIDRASCLHRLADVYDAMGIPHPHSGNIKVWNLRGHALPLDQLAPIIIRRVKKRGYDAIILDPIYKVITGDENSASEMGAFCNQFDKIASETGCSVIYCHHHSKGAQGGKKAQDRASGSGVFARDPDAQLDMIELKLSDDLKNNVRDGRATAWRIEASLREFRPFVPRCFWFDYPIHRLDQENLAQAPAEGSRDANLATSQKRTSPEERERRLDNAYDSCCENGHAKISEMAEYLGVSSKTVSRYIREYADIYTSENGIVFRKVG